MTRRGLLIEDRRRLSLAYRWRDRCLTVALLGVWWHPADVIRHVIASEAFRWNVFVTDLCGVLTVTGAAVALTLGWGTYDGLCGGRSVPLETAARFSASREFVTAAEDAAEWMYYHPASDPLERVDLPSPESP